MKKFTKTLGTIFFTALLGLSSPAIAQNSDNTTTSDTRSANDNNDTGKWGLAGLLGLLGLLGLKKRDDDRRTTVNK